MVSQPLESMMAIDLASFVVRMNQNSQIQQGTQGNLNQKSENTVQSNSKNLGKMSNQYSNRKEEPIDNQTSQQQMPVQNSGRSTMQGLKKNKNTENSNPQPENSNPGKQAKQQQAPMR